MTVKRSDVYLAGRLSSPLYNPDSTKTVSPQALTPILSKAKTRYGAAGAKAIKAAYDAAKTKAGANPTFAAVRAQLQRAESSVGNERAKGRINDGYVDGREAGALKSDVAKAVYAYLEPLSKVTAPADANVRATQPQLTAALKQLNKAAEAGFKAFSKLADGNYYQLTSEMRKAAKAAGLGKNGEATLIIATNGVTGRGDNGSLTDGGNSLPSLAEIKKALQNAGAKLLAADGAPIVDFDRPGRSPISRRDGVIRGLEVDRTPSVQGKAAHALLAFASEIWF